MAENGPSKEAHEEVYELLWGVVKIATATLRVVLAHSDSYMLKSREIFSALLLTRSGRQSPTAPSTQKNAPKPTTPAPPPSHRAR